MFGVSEPSCSSSDGSCSQISYGAKEIKQEDNNFQGFGSCYDQDNNNNNTQKFMLSNYIGHNNNNNGGNGSHHENVNQWSTHEKGNGYYGTDYCSLEYDLEDVKRLISSNNNNNNFNFNFNIDENKTQQEKVMYYYNY
ncbi:protein ODORANT1-like protein [Corchorus olitorius]|uniref:Protein ODORANT1-like protein n=1 Tax=Corchorus olitorius TaxID=93759 RepID=A0A1R3K5W0_9ROSI|nr:protein ODORANT1-like protein [Corchorus olitorius]